jgi:hypothetical protein
MIATSSPSARRDIVNPNTIEGDGPVEVSDPNADVGYTFNCHRLHSRVYQLGAPPEGVSRRKEE